MALSPSLVLTAAWLFAALAGLVALFQLALALGAPWGAVAMGGVHPGRLPHAYRIAALGQMVLLGLLALVVLSGAGLYPDPQNWSAVLVWVAVGFSALAVVANLATPSRWERRIWAPVAVLMFLSSLAVALA